MYLSWALLWREMISRGRNRDGWRTRGVPKIRGPRWHNAWFSIRSSLPSSIRTCIHKNISWDSTTFPKYYPLRSQRSGALSSFGFSNLKIYWFKCICKSNLKNKHVNLMKIMTFKAFNYITRLTIYNRFILKILLE